MTDLARFTMPWPPTVNTYYRALPGRKGGVILSEKGRQYLNRFAEHTILNRESGWVIPDMITEPCGIALVYYPPDKRKRDLDNLLKSTLDTVVKAGILDDDSLIHRLLAHKMAGDQRRGLVHVRIHTLEEQYHD